MIGSIEMEDWVLRQRRISSLVDGRESAHYLRRRIFQGVMAPENYSQSSSPKDFTTKIRAQSRSDIETTLRTPKAIATASTVGPFVSTAIVRTERGDKTKKRKWREKKRKDNRTGCIPGMLKIQHSFGPSQEKLVKDLHITSRAHRRMEP